MPRENRVRSIFETQLNRAWERNYLSEREVVAGQLISRFGKGELELWFVIMTKAKVDTHMEKPQIHELYYSKSANFVCVPVR
jgi:hypothetical protein